MKLKQKMKRKEGIHRYRFKRIGDGSTWVGWGAFHLGNCIGEYVEKEDAKECYDNFRYQRKAY